MSAEVEHSVEKTHPPTRVYVAVFVALAIITAIELALSSDLVQLSRSVLTPLFLIGSFFKAGLVAAFYMHLKYDNRLYTYIFVIPVILLIVFAIMATIS